MALLAVVALAFIVAGLLLGPWQWTAVMAGAALLYGSLSPIIYARRLQFLAGASPHAALSAAGIALIVSEVAGTGQYMVQIAVGLGLVLAAGALIRSGRDPDEVASLLAAGGSVVGVASLYAASVLGSTGVMAVVAGDPLLASTVEAAGIAVLGAVIAGLAYYLAPLASYIGVDPDDARLAGKRVDLVEAALYSMLGLAAAALITVVGFVVEHVLLLIPGAIAARLTRGSRESILASMEISVIASMTGLLASMEAPIPPAAVAGAILLAVYVASARGVGHGG
ncbi:MAG: metal ABC transporter permease [Desulfurococcales archaeon]|nr:metal ABC transporter permease [Desulfurococcales archaeon]